MSKGLEALHHPRIKSAKVDISAEGKNDIAYMFFGNTKQYAAIEQELKALDIIDSLFDLSTALRFPSNQPMLRITNKRTDEYWEIPLTQGQYESVREALP